MTAEIRAGRRSVPISRPDKVLFPGGITKADLGRYYERVAETMLGHIAERPLNLERYPDGIEGRRIMQQRASDYFPSWIRRVRVPSRGDPVEHVVATEPATLVYLAGQACVTLHQWLSRRDRLDRPGRLLIDIQRNAYAHTSVAPYAARPKPAAPVATPLHWEELDRSSTRADQWTIASVPRRLKREGDPWTGIAGSACALTIPRKRLRELIAEAGAAGRPQVRTDPSGE